LINRIENKLKTQGAGQLTNKFLDIISVPLSSKAVVGNPTACLDRDTDIAGSGDNYPKQMAGSPAASNVVGYSVGNAPPSTLNQLNLSYHTPRPPEDHVNINRCHKSPKQRLRYGLGCHFGSHHHQFGSRYTASAVARARVMP